MATKAQPARYDEHQGNLKHVGDLMREVKTCMFTTVGDDGLVSRPMYMNQKADFDGTLWFFTYASSRKVRDVGRHPAVNLGFALPNDDQWLSVRGTAEVVRDRGTIDDLWQGFLKAYFPNGKDDPDVALLKVTAHGAELWDGQKPIATKAFELAKGFLTREPAQPADDVKLDLAPDR